MRKIALFLFAFSFSCAFAQDSTLVVGLKETPPFIKRSATGRPAGLSFQFWEMIDETVSGKVEYRWYDNLEEMLAAVAIQEVDMSINPVTVTEQRMDSLDFSQPYFISGTAIARRSESTWILFLKNFFSQQFLSAVGILLGVIFFFGILVWLFERKASSQQFRSNHRGIFDGFWWSAVTMTTVGYGDKSPETTGGRTVAFIWMFLAILLISGLTAGIASALTVTSIESKVESVEDLRRFKTATIDGTGTAEFLRLYGLPNQYFETVEEGLSALEAEEIDIFIYDRPVLRYTLQKEGYQGLIIEDRNLKTDYYSFAYPKNSPLRNHFDPMIVRSLKTDSWNYILRKTQKKGEE